MDRDLVRDLAPVFGVGVIAVGSLAVAAWLDLRGIRDTRTAARDAETFSRHADDPDSWVNARDYLRTRRGVGSSNSRSRRRAA